MKNFKKNRQFKKKKKKKYYLFILIIFYEIFTNVLFFSVMEKCFDYFDIEHFLYIDILLKM